MIKQIEYSNKKMKFEVEMYYLAVPEGLLHWDFYYFNKIVGLDKVNTANYIYLAIFSFKLKQVLKCQHKIRINVPTVFVLFSRKLGNLVQKKRH